LVFPFFPVGRAKLFGQKKLDAAHVVLREICGLKRDTPALKWSPRLVHAEPARRAD
jgi:hypothetical protein